MGKRYWEDLVEGERFTCRPVAFDREGIVSFGKEYDPLPFHADEDAARRSIFGDVIASALHTISACTRVVVEAHGDIAILSGLSIDEIRTSNPVRPGDVLTVEGRWDGLRRSRGKPKTARTSSAERAWSVKELPVVLGAASETIASAFPPRKDSSSCGKAGSVRSRCQNRKFSPGSGAIGRGATG